MLLASGPSPVPTVAVTVLLPAVALVAATFPPPPPTVAVALAVLPTLALACAVLLPPTVTLALTPPAFTSTASAPETRRPEQESGRRRCNHQSIAGHDVFSACLRRTGLPPFVVKDKRARGTTFRGVDAAH